ncbi:hypothetical protein V8E36_000531 [Tilletia maclaganii]
MAEYANVAADPVRDATSTTMSQLKPDAHTVSLLFSVLKTAAEPHLLRYLAYPFGLVFLTLYLLRASVFAPARAKGDAVDRTPRRLFGLFALASAALSGYYIIQNSIWSFEEFEDRAHLVGNLISPLPKSSLHPIIKLGAHVQRSIDWLYDSQPLVEALKSLAAHEGVWWTTAERLMLVSGAWLVLLQAEGHRLALPFRALYAIIALLGPISLAQSLFFLALLTRAVPDGTLSNSAEFILAADSKGSFHALSEAAKHAAEAGNGPVPPVTAIQNTTVTSTRSRLARNSLRRTSSQQNLAAANGLPNGQEQEAEVIEEQNIIAGELDLDPPSHVLSHLTLWVTYFAAVQLLRHGLQTLGSNNAREGYSLFALSVLAPFVVPLLLKFSTSLPHHLSELPDRLHSHLKDGWLYFALFACSAYFKVSNTVAAYRLLKASLPAEKATIPLLVRFLTQGRPSVLRSRVLQLHRNAYTRHGGFFGSANPPAVRFAMLDLYLASIVTASWILYDRARLNRAGAFPARTATKWRLHAHLSVATVVLLGPAAGLSLWASLREAQLTRNELKDERKLGRSLHLGTARSLELKHHVLVQQQQTRVTVRRDGGPAISGGGAELNNGHAPEPAAADLHAHIGMRPPRDSIPVLAGLNGESSASASGRAPRASARTSTRRAATMSPGLSDEEGGLQQSTRSRRSNARRA